MENTIEKTKYRASRTPLKPGEAGRQSLFYTMGHPSFLIEISAPSQE